MNKDETFLSRWSRLKRGEAAEQTPEADHAPEPATNASPADAPAGTDATAEDEPLDLSTLPRLEDLTGQSDIRAFLDPRVPDGLRTEALRRAWRLDPVIDTFIEVAENQYDWNTPGGAPGFGPLVAGPDLPQLLAQATGRLFEAPEAVPSADHTQTEAKPETVYFADGADAAGQAFAAVPNEAPSAADAPVTNDPAAAGETDATAQSEEPPRQASLRRHGSALPR